MNNQIKKNIQIIAYLLQKEGKMNYMKLIKLVYFSDKLHLKKYGRLITDDSYLAMKNGPVASLTLNIIKTPHLLSIENELPFKNNGEYELVVTTPIKKFDRISKGDQETLDIVYNTFCNYNERQLSGLTHKYNEWKNLEEKVNAESRVEMPIDSFFEDSEEQNEIFNIPANELETAKDLYHERYDYAI